MKCMKLIGTGQVLFVGMSRVKNGKKPLFLSLAGHQASCYNKPKGETALTMTSFEQVLQNYRDTSFSERDKGYRFERLMQSYLNTDPTMQGFFPQFGSGTSSHSKNNYYSIYSIYFNFNLLCFLAFLSNIDINLTKYEESVNYQNIVVTAGKPTTSASQTCCIT